VNDESLVEAVPGATPVLAVYGPRRSGMNYVSSMLLANTAYAVANFDEKPARRIVENPSSRLLFELHGSKSDLLDRPAELKYPKGASCVFVFRPLFSWIFSRVAYHRTYAVLPALGIASLVRRVIKTEYLLMLRTLTDHLEGPLKQVPVALVNFESLLSSGFGPWFDHVGLGHQTPLQVIQNEVTAGGGMGRLYQRKGPEQLVPETGLHAEILDICAEALAGCDVRTLDLYDKIFSPEPGMMLASNSAQAVAPKEEKQNSTSFWLGRFSVRPQGDSDVVLKDRLHPGGRLVPRALLAGLPPRTRDLIYFRHGFVRPVLGAVGAEVVDVARGPDDLLVWHGPPRTEQAAMAAHAGVVGPLLADGAMHVYLGLPWATWIDRMLQTGDATEAVLPAAAAQQLQLVGIQLHGYRNALAELDTQLRVHTVCQHVQWPRLQEAWRALGVTDLWLSHCPADDVPGFKLHPWRLWSTQLEDSGRAEGPPLMVDPETKPLLASFVGHLPDHAIDDIRPRLAALADDKRMHITLLPAAPLHADAAAPAWPDAAADNQVLSDSVFSLCPAGEGANTPRLWESLAVGAVPVLIGGASSQPRLPEGGSLPAVDWSSIVVRVSGDDLAGLPTLLANMPMDEVRRRQQLGREAFEQVIRQRCF